MNYGAKITPGNAPEAIRLLIQGAWPGVHSAHARLIHYPNRQIVVNAYLTGKSHVLCQVCLYGQAITLQLLYFTWVAAKNFNAASRAPSVSPAAMQYVNAGVFNCQH